MRVAVLGKQHTVCELIIECVKQGHDVAVVFCPTNDMAVDVARRYSIPVYEFSTVKDHRAHITLEQAEVDIALYAHFQHHIPDTFSIIPKYGSIELHPSLLPKYKGPCALNWAIMCGETETGVTVFRPTSGIDEGPIILQKKIPITPNDTLYSLAYKMIPVGVSAILEAARLIINGTAIERSHGGHSMYERAVGENESKINWYAHSTIIFNQIRGCDPIPGAWTTYNGSKVTIVDTTLEHVEKFSDIKGIPGEVIHSDEFRTSIACHGGILHTVSTGIPVGTYLPS